MRSFDAWKRKQLQDPAVKKAYDAQLEGKFFNLPEALDWLRREVGIPSG